MTSSACPRPYRSCSSRSVPNRHTRPPLGDSLGTSTERSYARTGIERCKGWFSLTIHSRPVENEGPEEILVQQFMGRSEAFKVQCDLAWNPGIAGTSPGVI